MYATMQRSISQGSKIVTPLSFVRNNANYHTRLLSRLSNISPETNSPEENLHSTLRLSKAYYYSTMLDTKKKYHADSNIYSIRLFSTTLDEKEKKEPSNDIEEKETEEVEIAGTTFFEETESEESDIEELSARNEKLEDSMTLYIGNLPPGSNWTTVHEFILETTTRGPEDFHSLYIPQNKETQQLRSYGFLKVSKDIVEDVIQGLNGATFNDKTIVCSITESDFVSLYLGNLPQGYTWNEINDFVLKTTNKDIDEILNLYIPTNTNTGEQRSYGFLKVTRDAADEVVTALHNQTFGDKEIICNVKRSKEQTKQLQASKNERRVYIGNLIFDVTEEDIRQVFEPYGTVEHVALPVDRVTGETRGFGFVSMSSVEEVERVIQELNGYNLLGRNLTVNKARMPDDRSPSSMKIFVGNLPLDVTEEHLAELFMDYGTVLQCNLPTNSGTGRPRGFGFISMSPDDAENAIEALDGINLDGRMLRVHEAQRKRDEQSIPEANYYYN